MSELDELPAGETAGSLLRAAREKQGLHIAALAASIKVTPRKLDALEHDRYDELPDATFTRALAQTVCRSLKIDPQPVLALLPHAEAPPLEHVAGSLNTPFRDRPGREAPAGLATAAIRPLVWAGGVLLLAAAVLYFLPSGLLQFPHEQAEAPPPAAGVAGAGADAASANEPALAPVDDAASAPVTTPAADNAASTPAAPASALISTVNSAVNGTPAAPASAPPATTSAGVVQLTADATSWVELRDASDKVLLSRVLQPGESLGFDGASPFRLTIGNAQATRLSFHGKPVDLAPKTRDNVARLQLQ